MKGREVCFLILLPVLIGAWGPAGLAQGNQGGDAQASERSRAGDKPMTAQAGANTTAGTTTGSSGPSEPQSGSDVSTTLSSAALCASYVGLVRSNCLAKVTRNPEAE